MLLYCHFSERKRYQNALAKEKSGSIIKSIEGNLITDSSKYHKRFIYTYGLYHIYNK